MRFRNLRSSTRFFTFFLLAFGPTIAVHARFSSEHVAAYGTGPFDSFEDVWPTPTDYRTASGTPGPGYWQQKADYIIHAELDVAAQMLRGEETIRYTNHSPHTLTFLWVQLDQNAFDPESASHRGSQFRDFEENDEAEDESQSLSTRSYRTLKFRETFAGGYTLRHVRTTDGADLSYSVVETAMRLDLPQPLGPGETIAFSIAWEFPILTEAFAQRYGVKQLEADNAPVFQIAQWYPRMCAYSETAGWQLAPYLGSGEFALEFGDFDVSLTVPANFVVAATGELRNADSVLTAAQRERLETAKTASDPVFVVTREEAAQARKQATEGATKTWHFAAEQVRDFAFAASPAYLWDAMGVRIEDETKLAMSVYPAEAMPLWDTYSTAAVAATLEGYSRYVYPYPYPVAWSCWGAEGGMEYPMVSFQQGEIEDDGTYSLEERLYVISVIIHEVGHNWFPMILNTDERKWMWLDEGLNSFVESLVGMEFDQRLRQDYWDGEQYTVDLLAGDGEDIIMRQADFMTQRGFSAYSKPALGLMMLRESILGPDSFDAAMHEYARRWAFRRPIPADFFRTFEEVSGQDLDWFWRGWFYGDAGVDRAIRDVTSYRQDPSDLATRRALDRADEAAKHDKPFDRKLFHRPTLTEKNPRLQDFYYEFDPYAPTAQEREEAADAIEDLEPWERALLDDDTFLHLITIENVGGLIMPLNLRLTFADGGTRDLRCPAQLWAKDQQFARIPVIDKRELVLVELDPGNPFRDTALRDNRYPQTIETHRFFLEPSERDPNPMREAREAAVETDEEN